MKSLSSSFAAASLALSMVWAHAQVSTFAPPLPEEITSLFIPPTRSDEPYAATPHAIYRFEPARNAWNPIYASSASQSTIQNISGYAKSSKVLYVAHSKGAAITTDEGVSWKECDLPDFPADAGHSVGVTVHPADRKEAVLAWHTGAWITRNYGESFTKLDLPENSYPIHAARFIGGDNATLVLRTPNHLLLQTPGSASWIRIPTPAATQTGFACSMDPAVVLLPAPSECTIIDVNQPGMTGTQPCPPDFTAVETAADPTTPSSIWSLSNNQISLTQIGNNPASRTLYESKDAIEHLTPHPRLAGALYWSEDTQIMLLTNAVELTATTPGAAINLTSLSMGPIEILSQDASQTSQASAVDPQTIINEVMQEQPPLNLVLDSAIKHSDFTPDELAEWKKKVRTRNLLPTLRVGGGARELPYDETIIVSETDRYGITTQNDLRLSDSVRSFGYVAAFVEWDLGKLLYDPEQVDINKEKRYSSKARNDLVKMVNGLYFERINSLAKYRLHESRMSPDDKITALLNIQENRALLNNLCGAELFTN